MTPKILNLFVLFLFSYSENTQAKFIDTDCSKYDNKNDCISEQACSWCNITDVSDDNDTVVISSCKNYLPCLNDVECIYSDEVALNTECVFVSLLIFILIVTGFLLTLYLLLQSLKNLLNYIDTPDRVKTPVISLVSFIVIVPNLLFFFLNIQYFIYYYVSILITALCASGISKIYIKKYRNYQLLEDNYNDIEEDVPKYYEINGPINMETDNTEK